MPVQTNHRNPSHIAFVVGVVAIVLVVTALVGYNLWRLRTVAIDNQLGSAAQYANAFEEHLTQTLGVVDINLVTLGEQSVSQEALLAVIRNARYLRSISVVGSKGNILASSDPRNVGIAFVDKSFLPEANGPLPLLRVAPLMQGRDLYDARAIAQGSEAPAQSFIAVRRDVAQAQGGFVTLVAVINPDYFLNYYGRNLNVDVAEVQLLRLDGGLILSTAQLFFPASKDNAWAMEMLSKAESGRLRDDLRAGAARLTAYRVSKNFPFVAVVHLDLAKGLDAWREEAKWTASFVLLVLALSLTMAVYYFLRMQRLALERETSLLALNNQKYALDQHAIVSITAPSGMITYANDRFCSISGYSREELLGQQHRLVKSAHHPAAFFDTLWHTISQGNVWHGEVCNRKKNGDLYWVSATIVPLLGAHGMVEQYIAIRTDITHQKQIEQSLEVAKNAAEQANLAKSQFLANMSHEIRTPMNAILGILQLLQRTALTPEQDDYASKTEGAARSLLGLLNDILDFSKVEAGKMALDHRPFALDQMLRDISVILASNLGDKPVRLTLDVAPDVPLGLIGDEMRLGQILVNLGGNAIKFTKAGEVVLQVRLRARDATSATLEFLVRDTGIGIDPEHLAHIFDGFSQAESSTTRRFGGTGLGLAICKQLVHLMAGDLQVRSTPGQGSSFFFSVSLPLTGPAEPREAPAPAPLPGKKLPRLTGMRLLVVEDNKINQMVAKGLLSQEGASITLAENGALGVEAVARTQPPFHAVLMDLQMPVMDGFEATRRIRQDLAQTGIPIIAMTANVMASDREACLEVGMNDHVGKPFELDHLIAVLNKHTGFAAPAPGSVQAAAPDNADYPLGDLDLAGALARMGGDERMLANVLQSFAREVVQAPQQLLDQLAERKLRRAAGFLHSLKGMASTVGARHLTAVASHLEKWVQSGAPPQEQDAMVDSLRFAVQALSDTMAPVLLAYEAADARAAQTAADLPALDRLQLRQALCELTSLLGSSNLHALRVQASIEEAFGPHLLQELKPLKESMALMDFQGAIVHCAELVQAHCEPH